MLPKGLVLGDDERRATWGDVEPSGATYTGESETTVPVMPFMVFGVTYDLDIVLMSEHPSWEMHEYARIQTPEGPLWIAKDTRASNGNQLLVAGLDALYDWMPEIPLARKSHPVEVTGTTEGESLDLEIRYENHDGEPVHVTYRGLAPQSKLRKRNGSTMGHSRHQVMAVLDLPRREFGDDASIHIGGEPVGIERLLWIKPMRMALTQTQGGIAEGRYRQHPGSSSSEAPETVQTTHDMPGGPEVDQTWQIEREADHLVVRQHSDLRTLVYRFRVTDAGARELVEARVEPWNGDAPLFRVRFAPSLPDLGRPFEGIHRSRYVMDVGGQRNHAVGTIEARHRGGRTRLETRGEAPWWIANRCATTTVESDDGAGVEVETRVRPCD
jgi:hypothetical protein